MMNQNNIPAILSNLHTFNSLKTLQSSLVNSKCPFSELKSELYIKIINCFPDLKQSKKTLEQQVECLINTLAEDSVFQKVATFLKQYDELLFLLKRSLEENKQKIIKHKEKTVKKVLKMENIQNPKETENQVFVRLSPKNQNTTRFMIKAKKCPRLEIKLSKKQHMQHLVSHIRNKWLKHEAQQIIFYPQLTKGTSESQEVDMFLMVTDILSGYSWPQPNVISLSYEIKQPYELKVTKVEEKKTMQSVQEKKQEHMRGSFDNYGKDNSIFFHNYNSMDFDQKSGMFGLYNSIDFQFHKPDFQNSSFSLVQPPIASTVPDLKAIRQSIQLIQTEGRAQQNSFRQLRNSEETIIVPTIKKKVKN